MQYLHYVTAAGVIIPLMLFLGVSVIAAIRAVQGEGEVVTYPDGSFGSNDNDLAMLQCISSLVGMLVALILFPLVIWNTWGSDLAYFLSAALILGLAELIWSYKEL